jgi:proteasome lid subunit RPN8/RPN11
LSPSVFRITRRHYDIIVKQALDNLPQESGGFLGGKEGYIQAILPIFNQHLFNRTDTFSFTPDDVTRARAFFDKHGLSYIGMYHSHPRGVPEPSEPDIQSGQPCHFIIGARDPKKPVVRAYVVNGRAVIATPIEIVESDKVQVVDIHAGPENKDAKKGKTAAKNRTIFDDAEELNQKLNSMKDEKKVNYPKLEPKKYDSDFSTLA